MMPYWFTRKVWIVLFSVLMLFILVPLSSATAAEGWIVQGDLYKKEDRQLEALQAYEKATEIDPGNYLAWQKKYQLIGALLLFNTLNATQYRDEYMAAQEKAQSLVDQAIANNPADKKAWKAKGDLGIRVMGGSDPKSSEAYNRSLEIDPNYVDALVGKGYMTMYSGYDPKMSAESALPLFDRAIAIDPGSAEAWYNKGLAFVTMERYDDALSSLDQATRLDPRNVNYFIAKTIPLIRTNREAEAVAAAKQAYAINPDSLSVLTGLGVAHYWNCEYNEAISVYDRAIQLQSDNPSMVSVLSHERNQSAEMLASPYPPARCQEKAQAGKIPAKGTYSPSAGSTTGPNRTPMSLVTPIIGIASVVVGLGFLRERKE